MKKFDLLFFLVFGFVLTMLTVMMLVFDGYLVMDNANMGRPDLWFIIIVYLVPCAFMVLYGYEKLREQAIIIFCNIMVASTRSRDKVRHIRPPVEYVVKIVAALRKVAFSDDELKVAVKALSVKDEKYDAALGLLLQTCKLTDAERESWRLRLGLHSLYVGWGIDKVKISGRGEGIVYCVPARLAARRGRFVDIMARCAELTDKGHAQAEGWMIAECLKNIRGFKLIYTSLITGYEPDADNDVILVGDVYTRKCYVQQTNSAERISHLRDVLKERDTILYAARSEEKKLMDSRKPPVEHQPPQQMNGDQQQQRPQQNSQAVRT
jgi:uncharacterized protein (UPF0218 family)